MLHKPGQEIVADLVTQAPGTAVDHDGDLPPLQAERPGRLGVEDVLHDLDFQEMVPRAEGPELRPPPLQGPGTHLFRIGPGQAASVSVVSRSDSVPYPRPTAHRAPSTRT